MGTLMTFCFALLLGLISCQRRRANGEGPCYHFPGNGFIHFTPDGFLNNGSIHYEFEFRTNEPNGILMHTRGTSGDMETMYVRDGLLHYMLFNTSPSGVEGFFGGYFVGTQPVNTGDWVKVHVYRTWKEFDSQGRPQYKTGFAYKVGFMGTLTTHVDFRERTGIDLRSDIYFGGYSSSLSSTVGRLLGDIRDIRELRNGRVFEDLAGNFKARVTYCEEVTTTTQEPIIDGPGPV